MAEYSIKFPPGTEIDSPYAIVLHEVAKGATDAAVARHGQPVEMAESVPGTSRVSKPRDTITKRPLANGSKANSSQDDEMGAMIGVADNSRGNSHDHIGEEDGVLFRPFKLLPAEIRTMIWMAAAENAKPRGVYQFKLEDIKLGLSTSHYPLSQSLFSDTRQLSDDSPLVHGVRDLMQSVYNADVISTFTPLSPVGEFTLEIRNLLGSCPEARSELMRTPEFGGASFSFHWVRGGKCDLGVIRPFCYDTDWICLSGITHHPMIRPSTPGVIVTPDIVHIQHVAFLHADFSRVMNRQSVDMHLRTLAVFPSLKSVGMYEPCFSIKRVSHWDRLITQEDKLFLKGVSTSIPSTVQPRKLRFGRLWDALFHLKLLIQDLAVLTIRRKSENWDPGCANFANLQFCFMLHASSQEGLDLMKFKEDGSHLDDVARIEDLGMLGQEMKALRINGA